MTFQILSSFLDALMSNKIELEQMLSETTLKRFNNSSFAQGKIYKENQDYLDVDKELEEFLDNNTRNYIRADFLKQKNKREDEEAELKSIDANKKKNIIYFLVFMIMLSEIS